MVLDEGFSDGLLEETWVGFSGRRWSPFVPRVAKPAATILTEGALGMDHHTNYWYDRRESERNDIMPKNTSMTLGAHFEGFISSQIEAGRFKNASEVVRAGLRLLEEHEQKVEALRLALSEGEKSGIAGKLDREKIKREAREEAGLEPS